METFHLYHLAACWADRPAASKVGPTPLTTGPVSPTIEQRAGATASDLFAAPHTVPNSVIRAAAVQMAFASRTSQDFITPQQVEALESWTGRVSLEFHIQSSMREINRVDA